MFAPARPGASARAICAAAPPDESVVPWATGKACRSGLSARIRKERPGYGEPSRTWIVPPGEAVPAERWMPSGAACPGERPSIKANAGETRKERSVIGRYLQGTDGE